MLWLLIVFIILACALYYFEAPARVQKLVFFGLAVVFILFVLALLGVVGGFGDPVIIRRRG